MIFILLAVLKPLFYIAISFFVILFLLKLYFEPIKGVCKCKVDLSGKVVLITGGNSGLGLETAKNLARKGARVIIASRDTKKSKEAVKEIINETKNTDVDYRSLDLGDNDDIKRFAKEFESSEKRLDILVNNSGVAGLKLQLTNQAVDVVMQINYLGGFLLTNLLSNMLKKSKPSRIVVVASLANIFPKFDENDMFSARFTDALFDNFWRYANSKLYQILWTKALAKRLPEGVTINALHPGIVRTNIMENLPKFVGKLLNFIVDLYFRTVKEGIQTIVHLSVCPELENVSGGYYSDCQPAKHKSHLVGNDELIEKLWSASVKLTDKWTF